MAWPDGGTNPVTVSVGATARDHATLTLWEADTDEDCTSGWGGGIYASPCSPIGECYDDADFSEVLAIAGATTSEDYYRTLTVHPDQRHDGTAYGGGTTIATTSNGAPEVSAEKFCVLEWFIISGAYGDSPKSNNPPVDARHMYRFLIVTVTGTWGFYHSGGNSGMEVHIWNCIVYGPTERGINGITGKTFVVNCSILGTQYGTLWCDCYNVIVVGASDTNYLISTGDYNIGGDDTAPGGNSIDNIDKDDIYTNTGGGTEDLHLKSGATAAAGAGLDYSASFTTDIDGDARIAWDIGADEGEAGATDHEKAVGDTEGIADGLTRAVEYVRTASDAEGISDGLTKVSEYVRATSDAEGISDDLTKTSEYVRTASDAEGISDGLTLAMAYAQTVSDSEGVSDGLTKAVAYVRAVSDGEGISDGASSSASSGAARSKISCNLAQGSILLGGGMVCRMSVIVLMLGSLVL